jgi:WD40 repeat protein
LAGKTATPLNAADGSLIRPLDATHNRVNDAVFTLDDQDLIVGTGSPGDTLTLDEWRVSDGVRLLRLGAHTNGTHSVSLSSDGQLLLTSGTESRELKKWHVPDLNSIATFTNDDPDTGLPPEVDDSEFSPDDQLIGDSDIFGVKLRSAADGSLIRKIANAEIVSIAFSPDGTLIAGASPTERAVKIWSVADGTLVRTLPVTTDSNFQEWHSLRTGCSSSPFTVRRTQLGQSNFGGSTMAAASPFLPNRTTSTTSLSRPNRECLLTRSSAAA